ncbi:hypothetical protein H5P28_06700 [Ruficoccus amylovorans]|uniref:Uncharacterized protein n=1 Tax=Ruficoccus amylovorans TaxID=1804625 RepID=A0A842HD08_9BACT|nr:hypothetical protein [Ruficoccus amylovorans]MBC2593948.1 hypothetical protein [Ruficoccus amylovorans]
MPVSTKHILSIMLACLIVLNGLVAALGNLLVCLHEEGEAHLAGSEIAQACCHTAGASAEECRDCEDVALSGMDFLATRQYDVTASAVADVSPTVVEAVPPAWRTQWQAGPNPARGPPESTDTCLMVAQTVVLRL